MPISPKSRDELPPVLRGLQWVFQPPEVNEQIFTLLEQKVTGAKPPTGRPGMDLWHVLVLGVVHLALNCDYDRLEYLVHYDKLLRQLMGLESSFWRDFGHGFHHKTIRLNKRRQAIFEKPCDYVGFERVLIETHERVARWMLAYCMMPNHWH